MYACVLRWRQREMSGERGSLKITRPGNVSRYFRFTGSLACCPSYWNHMLLTLILRRCYFSESILLNDFKCRIEVSVTVWARLKKKTCDTKTCYLTHYDCMWMNLILQSVSLISFAVSVPIYEWPDATPV